MKSQTPHLSDYKLLIDLLEDLWQAPQLILPKNLLKEFMKLNVNMNKMIKNLKLTELHTEILTVFLNILTLKKI